mmetsp:Transcript_16055/g.44763  ORF Transcript_16055/g.44763 Transcript_16055/m.44763 type:complete len:366 (+) Transcript_16055:320-1417(+)
MTLPALDQLASLRLLSLDERTAGQVAEACKSDTEALKLGVAIEQDGVRLGKGGWCEFFSKREQRCYYRNEDIGEDGWDPPLLFRFREWQLDSESYGISLVVARLLFDSVQSMLSAQPHIGGGTRTPAQVALAVLVKLIGNVVGCDNSIPKFRTLKADNAKIAACIVGVQGAPEVLEAVGFRFDSEQNSFQLPSEAPLPPLRALLARLERLAASKGHTGDAKFNNDLVAESQSGSSASTFRFANQPGFRHQKEIFQCGVCERPIPDGTERLFSGSHDSPKGQFRYECNNCLAEGTGFNLCETCWDDFQAGRVSHDAAHSFQAHHPVTTRHNPQFASTEVDPRNPWNTRGVDGAARQRAYDRLMGRH